MGISSKQKKTRPYFCSEWAKLAALRRDLHGSDGSAAPRTSFTGRAKHPTLSELWGYSPWRLEPRAFHSFCSKRASSSLHTYFSGWKPSSPCRVLNAAPIFTSTPRLDAEEDCYTARTMCQVEKSQRANPEKNMTFQTQICGFYTHKNRHVGGFEAKAEIISKVPTLKRLNLFWVEIKGGNEILKTIPYFK